MSCIVRTEKLHLKLVFRPHTNVNTHCQTVVVNYRIIHVTFFLRFFSKKECDMNNPSLLFSSSAIFL